MVEYVQALLFLFIIREDVSPLIEGVIASSILIDVVQHG